VTLEGCTRQRLAMLSSKSKMYLLAFGVWLGGMYLLATINHALFGIVLGSSMIIGGISVLSG
jgi:hypothetical protein